MKLAEQNAREREKREREKREREAQQKADAAEAAKNQIQVKPIIETTTSNSKSLSANDSISRKMSNSHKSDDLLR